MGGSAGPLACNLQRRFWEHTIISEADYKYHVDYAHVNPLKHGLVQQVRDWPFSSFHRDVARGIYSSDWCGRMNKNENIREKYGES